MGMGWTDPGVAREANDYIIESSRKYPDRIRRLLLGEPRMGRCRRAGDRAMRQARSARNGELHPDTQGFDIGDAATMGPVLEVAEEYGLVITTHSSEPVGHIYAGKGSTNPQTLMRFIENARDYPNVKIVCAHWGGGLPFYALMPEVREALGNVWFDTAASPLLYTPEVFPAVAALLGPEKILPGSDFPLLRFGRIRRQAEQADVKVEDLAGDSPL